jgi:ATP-dependent helicase HepA
VAIDVVGQRCMSEREPELGLGVVARLEDGGRRVAIDFPGAGETRIYARGTTVLKRVQFRPGEKLHSRDGSTLTVEAVEEQAGLLTYLGQGRRVREDAISDVTSVALPHERLMAGQADSGELFDLRYRTLRLQARLRQSEVRGFLGGRVELIPHQFHILAEVAGRQIPRVLLADEVGLGKTIEACLIVQRLLAIGWARRVLVLVPESLTHQWFVELLRRFNLWFSIYDEERCAALTRTAAEANPFLGSQLVLCSVGFLAGSAPRREEAIAAGWDMVVVDEAHHLAWTPEQSSPEYALVERLARASTGLLLLTATPTQLGLAGHFARLRLLDPDRYSDFPRFVQEAEGFGAVAAVAGKILEQKPLTSADQRALQRIFDKDPAGLAERLTAVAQGRTGARDALIRTLLDQHGTGRVMFRNTRSMMSGFPPRKFRPVPLHSANLALLARIARELRAEETGTAGEIRYSFKDDPRIDWLVRFLQAHRPEKVLLICKSPRKVLAIDAALKEQTAVKVGLFHEGLPLVQRDRNAAWFAEPAGAQLLVCSEIGSEGRNFQFAHHLVLFDLPLNAGLLEQRIGRLDRIGQTQPIQIHVPYLVHSAEEVVVDWYHRGLNAFVAPLHGGTEYQARFQERVLALAAGGGDPAQRAAQLEALIAETKTFRAELLEKMKRGRDRLLELNSFNREAAERVVGRVRAADDDPELRAVLFELLEHFGVRVEEHEAGDVTINPSGYIEGFPSLPPEGLFGTFRRERALVREDIRFLSPDHPLVEDTLSLLVDAKAGTTAFGTIIADEPNLLLEAIYVLETVAESRWHVDRFLAPTPVRVVVDVRGRDLTAGQAAPALAAEFEDADVHRFLEREGFDAAVLDRMIATAGEQAEPRAQALRASADGTATQTLEAEIRRLEELQRVNENVRPEEITVARAQLAGTRAAIASARLRLDAIRLILAGAE